MLIIDFESMPNQAFMRGFIKGLGAPYILYGKFEVPAIQEWEPLEMPCRSDLEAMAGDWRAIGIVSER